MNFFRSNRYGKILLAVLAFGILIDIVFHHNRLLRVVGATPMLAFYLCYEWKKQTAEDPFSAVAAMVWPVVFTLWALSTAFVRYSNVATLSVLIGAAVVSIPLTILAASGRTFPVKVGESS